MSKTLSIYFPDDSLVQELERIAETEKRSISFIIVDRLTKVIQEKPISNDRKEEKTN